MKDKLDFIIIGAHKSGTSTLFKLLEQHDKIFIPWEKEVPYFGTEKETRGWKNYLEEYFNGADEDKLWGTVTPSYMCHESIPQKIHAVNSNTKLIAILRDPVSRSFSHYQMSKRRLLENRSFEEVISDSLQPDNLIAARANPTSTNAYIAWSEYGRIFNSYMKYFKREQIFICFTKDLAQNPQETINSICNFLNIESFTPKDLGKKFHHGGNARSKTLNNLFRKKMFSKTLLEKLIGRKTYVKLRYSLHQLNTKQSNENPNLKKKALASLHENFRKDLNEFEGSMKVKAPWRDYLHESI